MTDTFSRWQFDERLREQIAYVFHHDLLSICYDMTTGSKEAARRSPSPSAAKRTTSRGRHSKRSSSSSPSSSSAEKEADGAVDFDSDLSDAAAASSPSSSDDESAEEKKRSSSPPPLPSAPPPSLLPPIGPRPLGDLVDRRKDRKSLQLAEKVVSLIVGVLDDGEARFELSELMFKWDEERRRKAEAEQARRRDKIARRQRREQQRQQLHPHHHAADSSPPAPAHAAAAALLDDHLERDPNSTQRKLPVFPVPAQPIISREAIERVLEHHKRDPLPTAATLSRTISDGSPSPFKSRVAIADNLPRAYLKLFRCLYPHVAAQSDPPESFADVLDKVSLLLKLVGSSLPPAPRPLPGATPSELGTFSASVPSHAREALRRSRPLLSVHRPRPPTATHHFGADRAARAAASETAGRAVDLAEEEEARRRPVGRGLQARPKTAPGEEGKHAVQSRPGTAQPDVVRCDLAGSTAVFPRCFEDGANIESPSMGCSALLAAAQFGRVDVVQSLLSSPAALVNGRCPTTGRTALHLAALSRRFDVAALLIERGASKRVRDLDGMTPTDYGQECGDPESRNAARCLRDAPGRVMGLRSVDGDGFSVRLDWDDPKGLGYDVDPIDKAMVSVIAVAPRLVNPLYYKYLKILNMLPIKLPQPPNELDWVSVDTEDKPYKLTNLLPFETYHIRVCAHSYGGYGPNSRTLVHRTTPAAPSRPVGPPMFVASTNSSVTVSWLPPLYENGNPIEKYEISRRLIIVADKKTHGGAEGTPGDALFPDVREVVSPTLSLLSQDASLDEGEKNIHGAQPWVRQISNGSTPTFTATQIPHGAKIQIRVRAKNAFGTGPYGPISEQFEAVDPVRLIKKTANSLTIQWQMVPGKQVNYFELQRRRYGLTLSEDMYETMRNDIAPFPLVNGGIMHHVDDCGAGIEYQFRIRAQLEEGGWQSWIEGVVSNVFKTTETEPGPPSTPADKVGASTAKSIILEWSPGPSNGKPISSYEIWQNHVNASSPVGWELLETVKGALSLNVEGLELGGSYYFKARAKNEIGWGPFSSQSELISTNPIPIPGKPKQVGGGIGWVDLEWDVPVAEMLVDCYEVQKRVIEKTELGALPWEIVTSTITANRMLIQELGPCKVYEFRVRASTFDGWSSFSDISDPITTKRRY